jgi:hypothetical protein
LRPKAGDVVIVDGERYTVRAVGLKYLRLSTPDSKPVPGLVHQKYARNLGDAETESTSPLDHFAGTVNFDRDALLKR